MIAISFCTNGQGCRDSARGKWLRRLLSLGVNIQTKNDLSSKRFLFPMIWTVIGCTAFFLFYRHLVAQSLNEGFVLEELRLIMDPAIGLGKRLYWLGGRPLFAPAISALIFVLILMVFSLFGRNAHTSLARIIRANRWPVLVTASFSLMYMIGGTDSFPLYVVGIIAVPALGFLVQRLAADNVTSELYTDGDNKMILGVILLLGLILRLYKLDIFQHIQGIDEQLFARAALEFSEDPYGFFHNPAWEKAHLIRIACTRFVFSVLGIGLFQNRTVSAIEGTLCILFVFMLCRRLWGARVGIFAAVLLAVDPWHIGYSRAGVHEIEGPLFLILLLYLTARAIRDGGKWNFAALGAVTGATLYLYQSCFIMVPFAIGAVAFTRCFTHRVDRSVLTQEVLAMTAALILVLLPHFTVGWANLQELFSTQTMPKNFLGAARNHDVNPALMLFFNFWRGVESLAQWSPGTSHPSRVFYPNPISMGFSFMGLGVLLCSKEKFEDYLILLWIPVAFLPTILGYGFAERRLFATLVPVPTILAGLTLSKLWIHSGRENNARRTGLHRAFAIILLTCIIMTSIFIVFADTKLIAGGRPHPRKAAEFVRSLPPSYRVYISSQIKEFPFLFYITNYERLRRENQRELHKFVNFDQLQSLKEKIASTPGLAVVIDPGPEENRFLNSIATLNPTAKIIRQEDFWACLIPETSE